METIGQRHECDECDAVLTASEMAYDLRDLREGGSITLCRGCYYAMTWDGRWQLQLINATGEVVERDTFITPHSTPLDERFRLAYDKLLTASQQADGVLAQFYYREIPRTSMDFTAPMLELVKELFTSLRPIDNAVAQRFYAMIYKSLQELHLDELCSWAPSTDTGPVFSVDWLQLKTPVDVAVVHEMLSDIERRQGRCIAAKFNLWNLLRKPTPGENLFLQIEADKLKAKRLADQMRTEAERYSVGHDITTFNRMFVEILLKDPSTIHRLIQVGYFHGNMHRCSECKAIDGECPDCYSRDTEFDMLNDDILGTVWQRTLDRLGGNKRNPIADNSDGEEESM